MRSAVKVVMFLFAAVFVLWIAFVAVHGVESRFCMPDWKTFVASLSTFHASQRVSVLQGEIGALTNTVNYNVASLVRIVFSGNVFDGVTDIWSFPLAFVRYLMNLGIALGQFFGSFGDMLQIAFKSIACVLYWLSIPFEFVGWVIEGSMFACPVSS